MLIPCRYTPAQITVAVGLGATAIAGGVAASKDPAVAEALTGPLQRVYEHAEDSIPLLETHPKLVLGAVGSLALGGALYYR